LWGKLGDLACKYLNKGNQIAVSGRFQLDHWKDREGKERITPVVKVTQLALPPRLRVVANDDASSLPGDPFSDQAEGAAVSMTGEPTCEYFVDELDEPPTAELDVGDFPVPTRKVTQA
jgi:single-stranded DNA-binding protein